MAARRTRASKIDHSTQKRPSSVSETSTHTHTYADEHADPTRTPTREQPFVVETRMPTDPGCMYKSVRKFDDTLDSSPFELTLKFHAEVWDSVCERARTYTAPNRVIPLLPSATSTNATGRRSEDDVRLRDYLTHCLHVEVVGWNGRQLTLFTDDVPHETAIDPLELSVFRVDREERRAVLGVQRALPLSSAHGGAKFRLAVLLDVPGTAGAKPVQSVWFTETFRVLAKMGPHGSRQKQVHFQEYVPLTDERSARLRAILAAAAPMASAMDHNMDEPVPAPVAKDARALTHVAGEARPGTAPGGAATGHALASPPGFRLAGDAPREAKAALVSPAALAPRGGARRRGRADSADEADDVWSGDEEARAAYNAHRTSSRRRAAADGIGAEPVPSAPAGGTAGTKRPRALAAELGPEGDATSEAVVRGDSVGQKRVAAEMVPVGQAALPPRAPALSTALSADVAEPFLRGAPGGNGVVLSTALPSSLSSSLSSSLGGMLALTTSSALNTGAHNTLGINTTAPGIMPGMMTAAPPMPLGMPQFLRGPSFDDAMQKAPFTPEMLHAVNTSMPFPHLSRGVSGDFSSLMNMPLDQQRHLQASPTLSGVPSGSLFLMQPTSAGMPLFMPDLARHPSHDDWVNARAPGAEPARHEQ